MKSDKKLKFPSELRFDLVSKDWVIIATGRARKPGFYKKRKRIKFKASKKDCPFHNLKAQKRPVLAYYNGKEVLFKIGEIPEKWTTIVIPNKYPALLCYPDSKLDERKEGKFYKKMNAVGFAEIVLTKDHKKHFPHLKVSQIKEVFEVYQRRYLDLMKNKFVNYISIFHNHGVEAGASQPHPHSQIITTPLIDLDLRKALVSSGTYFKKNKRCIYCEMNAWERKNKKRVVFQNDSFVAICPFASKAAFEVIISPKRHLAYFEKINGYEKEQLAEIFGKIMKVIHKGLSDPAYNFYLHTAPCDGKDYSYYHWHWTIIPKTATPAGFEIGSGMEISTIEPEKAAEYLRAQLKK
jgi:UDPglucose--hexose-1-phosphate uridylyltransferase